jgi:hypothetical protein
MLLPLKRRRKSSLLSKDIGTNCSYQCWPAFRGLCSNSLSITYDERAKFAIVALAQLRHGMRHWNDFEGKQQRYWSLAETVRTADRPRQRTLCYLGELNGSAQARWLKTLEVFNEEGERHQLKLFPSEVEPPLKEAGVARVQLKRVRLERGRRLGECWVGLELWRRPGRMVSLRTGWTRLKRGRR